MRTLHLGDGLDLPLNVVTQKLGWLGRTGSGKTYGAQKLAEMLLAAKAQIVVLDPVGVWYALRLREDGRTEAHDIPVFGGLHHDIEIFPDTGTMIADLIVDRGISAVLDVSQFESDADKARFAAAFADRFFFRKKARPSPVHVFIEECQEFIPQNPAKGDERMLHYFTRMQKLGRNFGIGSSLISQRPQEVNKKVLNQVELLLAFQMTGRGEREAIAKWISDKNADETTDVVKTLPTLSVGVAHVWSPQWLGISREVGIGKKRTYNASSTPEVTGRGRRQVKLEPIDIEALKKDMAAVVERAKEEDPALLRAEVGKLRAALAMQVVAPAPATAPARIKRVEVPVLKEQQIKRLETASRKMSEAASEISAALLSGRVLLARMALPDMSPAPKLPAPPRALSPMQQVERTVRWEHIPSPNGRVSGSDRETRILKAVAELDARGIHKDIRAVARWLGLHPDGGRFRGSLASLRNQGKLDAGWNLGDPTHTPRLYSGGEHGVIEALAKQPQAQRVVQALNEHGITESSGRSWTIQDLAMSLGLHPDGGRFRGSVAWLRAMRVIPGGKIQLVDGVFA